MTSNLEYPLAAGVEAIASKNDRSTFTWRPGSCSTNGSCAMNGNTARDSSRGWYYSWYAATAGQGTADSASGDIDGSICPSGWRLPPNYTFSKNKSYGQLLTVYGLVENGGENGNNNNGVLSSFPFSFTISVLYWNGAWYHPASTYDGGYYWASTVYDSVYVHALGFFHQAGYVTYTSPSSRADRYYGFNVRCVAL